MSLVRSDGAGAPSLSAALEAGRSRGVCDLSGLGLTAVPPEVLRIPGLRELSLVGNRLTALPADLGDLVDLRVLALDDNRLASLPAGLGRLVHLEHLTLVGNLLTALPSEIGRLCSLESLTLSRNRLTSLPPEIGLLANLETLAASGNRLRELPAEIGGLNALQVLTVGHNQLTTLPHAVAGMLRAGLVLGVEGNPFDGPVAELHARDPLSLAEYLDALHEARPRYEAKLVLVGAGNAGKTSLLTALRGGRFLAGRPTTHGIEVHPVAVGGAEAGQAPAATVFAWDFGGQDIYRPTHQFFFTKGAVYLVVWNPRDAAAQADVVGWVRRIHQRVGTDARVFIVATHCAERRPDLDYAAIAAEFPDLLAGRFETDCSTGQGIAELALAVAAELGRLPRARRPASPRWIAAREEVLGLADTQPQVSFEKFESVCRRHGLRTDQAAALAETLHLDGRLVYHGDDDMLSGFVVLNPEWLTQAISFVLEDAPTGAAGGILDHARLRRIWGRRNGWPGYPAHHHPYFLRLMEKYDMSYRLAEDRSLVAQLVPHQRPALPWTAATPLPPGVRELSMVCRLSDPAPELIAWLTVRHHDAATGRLWRSGVFLRHPVPAYESEALIELLSPAELSIEVRAPSPDYFFSVLRYSMEGVITRRWPGVEYELLVPCPTRGAAGARCPGTMSLQDLLVYREEGETRFLCAKCRTRHDISVLLTGFAQPSVSLHAQLDHVHAQLRDDIAGVHAQVSAAQAAAADTAQIVRRLQRAVSAEIADCPRLFTLVRETHPQGARRLRIDQDHLRLTLWCEHPGNWHSWSAATYRIDEPKELVAKIAPYAALVFRALQLAVPVATGIAGVALAASATAQTQPELDLMAQLASELPSAPPAELASGHPAEGDQLTVAQDAGWRQLRALLSSLDPASVFGDLRRVQSPEGDFLWVCPEHAMIYDPGLPTIPASAPVKNSIMP